MDRSRVVPGRRVRRLLGRALPAALVLGCVAVVGGTSGPPPTALQVASYTDPAPPTNVRVTVNDRSLTITWTASAETGVVGYQVYLDGSPVTQVQGTSTTISNLVNGHSYVVTVTAGTTNPTGGYYESRTASTPTTATPRDTNPPTRPTGVRAARGDAQVTVSWTAVGDADADGYQVLRDGTPVSGLVSGRGTTTWTDTGLVNDRTYNYTVQAHDTSGNWSAASTPAVSATPTDLTPPGAPTGLVAANGDGQVTLSWTANPEPDLASYRVLRNGAEVATVTGATSYVDTGRTNDTSYSYTLVAVDTHGNRSAASSPAVSGRPTDLTPPAAPTGLVAAPGDGRVTLTWAANTEGDLASYRVLRYGAEVATVTGARTWTDTGLTNGQSYEYALVAVDTHGNRSAPAGPVAATPVDRTPPAAPTGLAATADDGRVSLSWTANAEPDLASYRVLRDGVEVATVTGGTTYLDGGLPNGTPHSYTLVAVDASGNRSPASAAVPATPVDRTPPGAPTDVSAIAGDEQATLRWTAPADPDVASYRVLGPDGGTLATVAAPATGATVPGLANGSSYRLTVVAVDAAGNVSPASAAVTVLPAAPTVPALGAGESGGVAVSGDGRFVVVGTRAALEAGDTNTAYELYLVDRTAGTRKRIAPLPATATGSADPTNTATPAVSDDGRYVVLSTTAALVAADTNRLLDVYRLDTTTGSWALVSVPAGGTVSATTAGTPAQVPSGSVYSTSPGVVVSADGDLVLFYSARTDLVARDTNNAVDVFAKRMSTGAVTRVSTSATGGDLPGPANGPALALTPDGRFALFVATGASGSSVLYRRDLTAAGATVVSTVTVSGRATEFTVYRDMGDVDLSDDGRYVVLSTANLVDTATPAATSSAGRAFRLDTTTGAVLALGAGQRTEWEHSVALDPTGRWAFFATTAAELPADGNTHTDHYRRDLAGGVAGPLLLVSTDKAGRSTAGPIGSPAPTEYGRLFAVTGDQVVLTSSQALVAGDANGGRDVYTKDLVTGVVGSPLG